MNTSKYDSSFAKKNNYLDNKRLKKCNSGRTFTGTYKDVQRARNRKPAAISLDYMTENIAVPHDQQA